MRALLFVLLLLFPFAGFSRSIRYDIAPAFGDGTLHLQVRASFAGDADGETRLRIPTRYGNAGHLFRCIRNLECPTPGCRLKIAPDSLFATLIHAPGQEVQLNYTVAQDYPGAGITSENAFRPALQPGWFHLLGNALFIAPEWNDPYELTLEWNGFPPGWLLHNSLTTNTPAPLFFPDLRWLESIFVGGDYRLRQGNVQGRPVWLAIRGRDWGFHDDSLFSMLLRTVTLQRHFWQDFETPDYTVVLTPLAFEAASAAGAGLSAGRVSSLGTGLYQSFAAFATPGRKQTAEDLQRLFHHEMMHAWIGGKIRNGCAGNDMQLAWFSEGFTDYFALKNMLRGGLLTADQYLDRLNGIAANLYRSPRREAPNRVIADSFFLDRDVEKLPYLRGCTFAFYLDNAMKAGSNHRRNLHGLLLEMLDYYGQNDRDMNRNFDFFLETGSEYLQNDLAAIYRTHILQGQLIPAGAFILPAYLKMEPDEAGFPVFRLDKRAAGWEKGLGE